MDYVEGILIFCYFVIFGSNRFAYTLPTILHEDISWGVLVHPGMTTCPHPLVAVFGIFDGFLNYQDANFLVRDYRRLFVAQFRAECLR